MFMKIGEWAMLQLYKKYNILATARVIKKLTQLNVSPYFILKKIDCLAYKLDIYDN